MGRTDPLPADSLSGIHVLVVDDDADSRHLLRTILRYCGALVTTASSAREALTVLERVVPDVLVCDIVMPGRSGYWLLSQVRKLPPERGGAVPALACTGQDDPRSERLSAAGFQMHIRKPIDPWALGRAVAALANRPLK